MFIAHLPAGYLLSRVAFDRSNRHLAVALMMGSIAPDVDLLVFYVWDHGAVHHHSYFSHRPAVWAGVLLGAMMLRQRFIAALCLGALLHLSLDSVAGAIDWGWPVFRLRAPLVLVPATQHYWVLSFVLHWTFAIEIAICLGAWGCWMKRA